MIMILNLHFTVEVDMVGDYISKFNDHVPKIVFYGWGGHGDYISMITFYSDYSKAEVDAVITAN